MVETFAYKVRDKQGQLLEGEMDSDSVAVVAARLRAQGFIPIEIDRKAGGGLKSEINIPGFSNRVKLKDLTIFSRQFSTMVNSGLTLLRTLTILEEQTENSELARIVGVVRQDVETGTSLSQSLAKHPKVFSDLYVAMVKAGETGGVLDDVLLRLADQLETQVKLRQKIKSAMAYPVMAMSLILVIVAAMLIFIVPQFAGLYDQLGGTLPLPTRMLIFVSNLLVPWGILAFIVIGIPGFILFKRWKKTEGGKLIWDRFLLRVPIFGMISHKAALARFASTFGVLLRSGVPILEALDITSDTVDNAVLSLAIVDVKNAVKGGESLAKPLTQHPIFPPMTVQMMAVGEETGALDLMLEKIAMFYESEVDAAVTALTSLIEPLLIVVMGVVVGGMLVSLYLPMFNIINLIE